MNGARALIETLADCGVEFCIANPGTSEMHLVQALDSVPRVKSVLALFEGVCTGAADGIGRMTGKPAATLLHLGPGLANGIANLHNARRANTPMVNIVGNHPHYHIGFDAPLTSDIETLARNYSCWVKSCSTSDSLAQDGADAVSASLRSHGGSNGQIATLIMGADSAWGESPGPVRPNPAPGRPKVDEQAIEHIAGLLGNGEPSALMLDHHANNPAALEAAGRIAAKTGCRLFNHTFPARVDGGPGRVAVERLPYAPEHALAATAGIRQLVLVGGDAPVSFFAYQGIPGRLLPADCAVSRLAAVEEDSVDALERLAGRLGAEKASPQRVERTEIPLPEGGIRMRTIIQAITSTMPEDIIVCTDSGGGNTAYPFCQNTATNSWLSLTGGAIGQGGPVATGAGLACPDRPVLALLGDGGAAYTNQCLWTQAREGLNVTTLIFANRTYNILNVEFARLNAGEPGEIAASLFDIDKPAIDWVQMAASFGVPGATATSADHLAKLLQQSYREPGPFLIEVNGQMER